MIVNLRCLAAFALASGLIWTAFLRPVSVQEAIAEIERDLQTRGHLLAAAGRVEPRLPHADANHHLPIAVLERTASNSS